MKDGAHDFLQKPVDSNHLLLIVERALDRLMTGRTTIVVAHRLSTIRRADRIAVVDHGRLAELGTHDELVALGGRYAALASAWDRSQPSV